MTPSVGYRRPSVPWNGLTVTDLFCGAGIRSVNPGYCFKQAGWCAAGFTRGHRPLVILAKEARA